MPFDPLQFGATPVNSPQSGGLLPPAQNNAQTGNSGGFNPLFFGATPVNKPAAQGSNLLPTTDDSQPQKINLSDINAPVYDMSQNQSGLLPTIGKSLANTAKSAVKFGKGVLSFFNPVSAVKNVAAIPSNLWETAKSQLSAKTAQDFANAGIDKVITALQTAKQQGKDTSRLENFLKTNVASKDPADVAGIKTILSSLGGATNQALLPEAAQDVEQGQFKKATESLANDPFQVAPILLGAKGAIDEGVIKGKTADIIDKTMAAPTEAIKTAAGKVKDVAGQAKDFATSQPVKDFIGIKPKVITPDAVDSAIQEGFSKGVKPTIIGKKSLAKQSAYYDAGKTVVTHMAQNRSKFNIIDPVTKEQVAYPTSNAEFTQAIDQGKQTVYDQYNALTKSATGKDAQVDVKPAVDALNKIANPGNRNFNPTIRAYAKSLIPEVSELQNASPKVLENRIADLNQSLKAYYNNPDRIGAAKAQVDASVASVLRKILDDKITQSEGPGYQKLKNTYGAYKNIEADVNKRAIVLARQNKISLPEVFTNIFTGETMLEGLMSLSPLKVAKGAFAQGIMKFIKQTNAPDTYIQKMFKTAYAGIPEVPDTTVPNTPKAVTGPPSVSSQSTPSSLLPPSASSDGQSSGDTQPYNFEKMPGETAEQQMARLKKNNPTLYPPFAK